MTGSTFSPSARTPGNWKTVFTRLGRFKIVSETGAKVALVYGHGDDIQQTVENVMLIKFSPACEKALEELFDVFLEGRSEDSFNEKEMAAIRKAERVLNRETKDGSGFCSSCKNDFKPIVYRTKFDQFCKDCGEAIKKDSK